MKATLDIAAFRAGIKSRLAPTQERMRQVAEFAQDQINQRFDTAGVSGGVLWPPSDFGTMGHAPPLAGLENSFVATAQEGEAKVASANFLTLVHHLGTEGKGGSLKTIVPVHAKALYIPLTTLGKESYEANKRAAPVITTVFSGAPQIRPASVRLASEAVYGVDFIFLKKVDLPPRPQLPTSIQERADLGRFTIKTLKS